MVTQNKGSDGPQKPNIEAQIMIQLSQSLSNAIFLHKSSSDRALLAIANPTTTPGMVALLEMIATQTAFLEALTHSFELSNFYQRSMAVSLQQLLLLAQKGA